MPPTPPPPFWPTGPAGRDGPPHPGQRPGSIGALLTRLRLDRGYTQLRLADLLCAASGVPTVSRHEISRWEREERVPGEFWLGWLAAVLQTPIAELRAAVAAARPRLPERPAVGAAVDLPRLAHTWLTNGLTDVPFAVADPPGRAGAGPSSPDDLAAELSGLRRLDDLVGGLDLAARTGRALRAVTGLARAAPADRPLLALAAQFGQLAGWTAADAGDGRAAVEAYAIALRAAAAAGERPLAAHVLGCASHLLVETAPHDALLLARTGYDGGRRVSSATAHALLLHRVAFAAARCGETRAARQALAAAQHAADRRAPEHDPAWLYWLDETEFAALTGRCLIALGRPLRAVPLLAAGAAPGPARGPRTAALYNGWLAHAYLDLGEVEQACHVAAGALRDAVRAGSVRATAPLRALQPRLVRHRDLPDVRRYARFVAAARPYLPSPAVSGVQPAGRRQTASVMM